MNMIFDFGDDASLEGVRFEGLTGREYVTSTKDALNVMKVKNPDTAFCQDVTAGIYDETPEDEYEQLFHAVKAVKGLWRYPGDPEDAVQEEMNILMLLANAIELISRQDAELRKHREKQG